MSDVVAIVSVAVSGTVGVVGTVSTAWTSASTRTWTSREKQTAELRAVLDQAASALAGATQGMYDANRDLDEVASLRTAAASASDEETRARESARVHLDDAERAQRNLWAIVNRLQVRMGAKSSVATALEHTERKLDVLLKVVRDRLLTDLATRGFGEAWNDAWEAENAFYEAASKALTSGVARVED